MHETRSYFGHVSLVGYMMQAMGLTVPVASTLHPCGSPTSPSPLLRFLAHVVLAVVFVVFLLLLILQGSEKAGGDSRRVEGVWPGRGPSSSSSASASPCRLRSRSRSRMEGGGARGGGGVRPPHALPLVVVAWTASRRRSQP
jgi:hypothetical protein